MIDRLEKLSHFSPQEVAQEGFPPAELFALIRKLTKPIIASIARRQYILVALSVAGF
ncbi:hypothetical protein I8751_10665 [Nostocaceae cyanobacterium CENA357]|uniref:Uncharacterized protein n=1 Tax=Atlanticothrix silvestris CENA357 TaxID=1725252 RepID=A0A8J7L2C3_9CYAN|nr:hypothetical protein [Atlanticothrix silvestris CENA357]